MTAPTEGAAANRSPMARLEQLLAAQESLLVEMRAALQGERTAMEGLDAEALEQAAQAKAGIAAELRLVEDARIVVARELARTLGIGDDAPTLTQLCARLGADGARLLGARDRLRALVTGNAELLEANSTFATRSLDEVRTTLEWIGNLAPRAPTYERAGQVTASRPSGGLLDRRA